MENKWPAPAPPAKLNGPNTQPQVLAGLQWLSEGMDGF